MTESDNTGAPEQSNSSTVPAVDSSSPRAAETAPSGSDIADGSNYLHHTDMNTREQQALEESSGADAAEAALARDKEISAHHLQSFAQQQSAAASTAPYSAASLSALHSLANEYQNIPGSQEMETKSEPLSTAANPADTLGDQYTEAQEASVEDHQSQEDYSSDAIDQTGNGSESYDDGTGYANGSADDGLSVPTSACDDCREEHRKCDKKRPYCSECIKRGMECVYSMPKKRGRPLVPPTKPARSSSRRGAGSSSSSTPYESSHSEPYIPEEGVASIVKRERREVASKAAAVISQAIAKEEEEEELEEEAELQKEAKREKRGSKKKDQSAAAAAAAASQSSVVGSSASSPHETATAVPIKNEYLEEQQQQYVQEEPEQENEYALRMAMPQQQQPEQPEQQQVQQQQQNAALLREFMPNQAAEQNTLAPIIEIFYSEFYHAADVLPKEVITQYTMDILSPEFSAIESLDQLPVVFLSKRAVIYAIQALVEERLGNNHAAEASFVHARDIIFNIRLGAVFNSLLENFDCAVALAFLALFLSAHNDEFEEAAKVYLRNVELHVAEMQRSLLEHQAKAQVNAALQASIAYQERCAQALAVLCSFIEVGLHMNHREHSETMPIIEKVEMARRYFSHLGPQIGIDFVGQITTDNIAAFMFELQEVIEYFRGETARIMENPHAVEPHDQRLLLQGFTSRALIDSLKLDYLVSLQKALMQEAQQDEENEQELSQSLYQIFNEQKASADSIAELVYQEAECLALCPPHMVRPIVLAANFHLQLFHSMQNELTAENREILSQYLEIEYSSLKELNARYPALLSITTPEHRCSYKSVFDNLATLAEILRQSAGNGETAAAAAVSAIPLPQAQQGQEAQVPLEQQAAFFTAPR